MFLLKGKRRVQINKQTEDLKIPFFFAIDFRTPLESFLNMSYMYYSVFGSFVTVIVGCIVSLLTNSHTYDSTLVHPTVSRFVRSKSELPITNEKPHQAIINSLSVPEKQREKF